MKKNFEYIEKRYIVGRFNSLFSAQGWSEHTIKKSGIILGDDGKFWVVLLGGFDWLIRHGYEAV